MKKYIIFFIFLLSTTLFICSNQLPVRAESIKEEFNQQVNEQIKDFDFSHQTVSINKTWDYW